MQVQYLSLNLIRALDLFPNKTNLVVTASRNLRRSNPLHSNKLFKVKEIAWSFARTRNDSNADGLIAMTDGFSLLSSSIKKVQQNANFL